MEKVLVWRGSNIKKVDKNQLFQFLAEKSNKNFNSNICQHGVYENAYEFILKNLNETTCIQVYQDNVIRLHLKHEYYSIPKSIFLDDYEICNNMMTVKLIEELITFSKHI